MRKSGLWIALVLAGVAAWTLWPTPRQDAPVPAPAGETRPVPPPARHGAAARPLPEFLPAEAAATLRAIERGGPFPYRQDGAVFGNRERLLPARPRGYYREYTVRTPGLDHRGRRRIVTGGSPPAAWYYTGDHYQSFRRFEVPR
jgi:guanyl-specific ribonuclease Sa